MHLFFLPDDFFPTIFFPLQYFHTWEKKLRIKSDWWGTTSSTWIIWFFFKSFIIRRLQENLNKFRIYFFFSISFLRHQIRPVAKMESPWHCYQLVAQNRSFTIQVMFKLTLKEQQCRGTSFVKASLPSSWAQPTLARPRKGDKSSIKRTETPPKLHESPNYSRMVKVVLHRCLQRQALWSGLSHDHLIRHEFVSWPVLEDDERAEASCLTCTRCWSNCFSVLQPKGAFHLPPHLETVTPTARRWYSAAFCADLSVWSRHPLAHRQRHLPPWAGTWWCCEARRGSTMWTPLLDPHSMSVSSQPTSGTTQVPNRSACLHWHPCWSAWVAVNEGVAK